MDINSNFVYLLYSEEYMTQILPSNSQKWSWESSYLAQSMKASLLWLLCERETEKILAMN